jgi:hypothetical protein
MASAHHALPLPLPLPVWVGGAEEEAEEVDEDDDADAMSLASGYGDAAAGEPMDFDGAAPGVEAGGNDAHPEAGEEAGEGAASSSPAPQGPVADDVHDGGPPPQLHAVAAASSPRVRHFALLDGVEWVPKSVGARDAAVVERVTESTGSSRDGGETFHPYGPIAEGDDALAAGSYTHLRCVGGDGTLFVVPRCNVLKEIHPDARNLKGERLGDLRAAGSEGIPVRDFVTPFFWGLFVAADGAKVVGQARSRHGGRDHLGRQAWLYQVRRTDGEVFEEAALEEIYHSYQPVQGRLSDRNLTWVIAEAVLALQDCAAAGTLVRHHNVVRDLVAVLANDVRKPSSMDNLWDAAPGNLDSFCVRALRGEAEKEAGDGRHATADALKDLADLIKPKHLLALKECYAQSASRVPSVVKLTLLLERFAADENALLAPEEKRASHWEVNGIRAAYILLQSIFGRGTRSLPPLGYHLTRQLNECMERTRNMPVLPGPPTVELLRTYHQYAEDHMHWTIDNDPKLSAALIVDGLYPEFALNPVVDDVQPESRQGELADDPNIYRGRSDAVAAVRALHCSECPLAANLRAVQHNFEGGGSRYGAAMRTTAPARRRELLNMEEDDRLVDADYCVRRLAEDGVVHHQKEGSGGVLKTSSVRVLMLEVSGDDTGPQTMCVPAYDTAYEGGLVLLEARRALCETGAPCPISPTRGVVFYDVFPPSAFHGGILDQIRRETVLRTVRQSFHTDLQRLLFPRTGPPPPGLMFSPRAMADAVRLAKEESAIVLGDAVSYSDMALTAGVEETDFEEMSVGRMKLSKVRLDRSLPVPLPHCVRCREAAPPSKQHTIHACAFETPSQEASTGLVLAAYTNAHGEAALGEEWYFSVAGKKGLPGAPHNADAPPASFSLEDALGLSSLLRRQWTEAAVDLDRDHAVRCGFALAYDLQDNPRNAAPEMCEYLAAHGLEELRRLIEEMCSSWRNAEEAAHAEKVKELAEANAVHAEMVEELAEKAKELAKNADKIERRKRRREEMTRQASSPATSCASEPEGKRLRFVQSAKRGRTVCLFVTPSHGTCEQPVTPGAVFAVGS